MIGDRPAIVDRRARIGDWEIDTVHGRGKACVVTIVERKCGLVRVGKLPRATAAHTLERTVATMHSDRDRVITITADNGTEFHMYKELEQQLDTRVYFATPHHAWERGTNENTNGLIRQYLPKRQSMARVTQQHCDLLAEELNQRPRKRHAYKSPNDCFHRT